MLRRFWIALACVLAVVVAVGSGLLTPASAATAGKQCSNFAQSTKVDLVRTGHLRVDVYRKKLSSGRHLWCWSAHTNVFSAADYKVLSVLSTPTGKLKEKTQGFRGKKFVGATHTTGKGRAVYVEIKADWSKSRRGYEDSTFLSLK